MSDDFLKGVRRGIAIATAYLDRDADAIDAGNHWGKVEPIADGNRRCAEIIRKYEGDIIFEYLDYDIDFPQDRYRVYEGEAIILSGTLGFVTEKMRGVDQDWTPTAFPRRYALKVWTPDGYRLAEEPYKQVE